ncbi:MAG: holo-ACP synthase [Opitutales bacterium]
MEDLKLPPGGYLVGLGADIVDVDRIRGVVERQGERFIRRVFTEEEREYCFGMKHPHKHLAARFAAKEAVSKAFTTGIGGELSWTSVSIYNGERGEPHVRFDEKGEALLKRIGAVRAWISLSHTDTLAHAVAVLLRD